MKYYIQWGGVWFRTDDRYPTFRWTDHVGKEMNDKGIQKPCGLFDETAENFTFSITFLVFHMCANDSWEVVYRDFFLQIISSQGRRLSLTLKLDRVLLWKASRKKIAWPHPFPPESSWVDLYQAKVIADFPTDHPCLQAFTVNFKRLLVRLAGTFSHNWAS